MMKQRGFILGSVLFFVMALSILLYLMMDISVMEIKMSQRYKEKINNHAVLYSALKLVTNDLSSHLEKPCLQQRKGNDYYAAQDDSWWSSHGCQLSFARENVTYVIEPLQRAPCLWVKEKNNKIQGGIFYRITMRLQTAEKNHTQFQQLIVLLPKQQQTILTCPDDALAIQKAGIQSWRVL